MDSTAALARAVGARVKHERNLRGWTLDQLAGAADVSRRMLINIEQGTTNPSIGLLLRISDALGVGLPVLVEPPEKASVRVTRSGDGAVLWTGEAGGRAVLVAGTAGPDVGELWEWTLGVGDRYRSKAHGPGTKELVQVQHGTLVLEVGDQSVTVAAGDAVAFGGDLPHGYANSGREPARFSLAVFEPGVGANSRSGAADA